MSVFAWSLREAVRLAPWAFIYFIAVWKVHS